MDDPNVVGPLEVALTAQVYELTDWGADVYLEKSAYEPMEYADFQAGISRQLNGLYALLTRD